MSKYYFLKVKEVVRETSDTVSIHFWHPLNELIRYKTGQFLTVLLPLAPDQQKIRRSYSFSSSPFTDVSPAITVKQVPEGLASGFLVTQVKPGDILEVMEPAGTFVIEPDESQKRRIFLIGAGSGITPLISIAKSILIVEPDSSVVLIYGNRRLQDIIFRDKLNALQQKYPERLHLVHSLTQPPPGWTGATGRLTKNHLIQLLEQFPLQEEDSRFFLCGPEEMMADAKRALSVLGVANRQILQESFATRHTTEERAAEHTGGPRTARIVTIRYEGEEFQLAIPPHQSILETALENDIDLPYSCQAGMCTACLGRVLSGKVFMDEYDGLSEAELQEGFILTCVAHPDSDDVIIEVD